ncbi:hypothetical protein B5E65_14080 [Gemmiger sp. An120]|uniref:hypothetical protein n=1 Tax=Gemmiger sp. An120 TaxID=1965549 RepID=UPI000B3A13D9|nr:hypothetical protein [Gemmiger sp. An120]OUQ40989.1 hypothetical protein B5E65_14080 [Gemmiger sp. An120]
MKSITKQKAVLAAAMILAAVLSFAVLAGALSAPSLHAGTINALEEKRDTVMGLAAASAAASAGITLIPGDVATPIADKLADLSSAFLVVLCAIYLEKYLVTMTFYVAFRYLVPAVCLLLVVNLFWQRDWLQRLMVKLVAFTVVICAVVPASMGLSGMIERTYSDSIEQTIASTEQAVESMENAAGDEEESGGLGGLLDQVVSGVTQAAEQVTEQVKTLLSRFLEALAVMIVTSCVIPAVVLLSFVWLANTILGMNVTLPKSMPHIVPHRSKV